MEIWVYCIPILDGKELVVRAPRNISATASRFIPPRLFLFLSDSTVSYRDTNISNTPHRRTIYQVNISVCTACRLKEPKRGRQKSGWLNIPKGAKALPPVPHVSRRSLAYTLPRREGNYGPLIYPPVSPQLRCLRYGMQKGNLKTGTTHLREEKRKKNRSA